MNFLPGAVVNSRLDNTVVMIVSCGPVARSSQCGGYRLE